MLGNPETDAAWQKLSCQKAIDRLPFIPHDKDSRPFGPEGSQGIPVQEQLSTIFSPRYVRSCCQGRDVTMLTKTVFAADRACAATVYSYPEGATDSSTWRRLWNIAHAVKALCVRGGQGGSSHGLGTQKKSHGGTNE